MTWETVESTGLLDDADIEITKAEFNYDASYDNGDTLILILEGTSDQEGWEEFTQFLSIGKGWETLDQGATVEGHENFKSNSQYALFFLAAIEVAGEALTSRGTPEQAKLWVGTKWHVKRGSHDYGDDIGVVQVLKPTAFLGVGSGKADAPAESVPEATGADNGSNTVLRAHLIKLAKESSSHDDFIENMMEKHPEVSDDDELFAAALDPSGFYADHK